MLAINQKWCQTDKSHTLKLIQIGDWTDFWFCFGTLLVAIWKDLKTNQKVCDIFLDGKFLCIQFCPFCCMKNVKKCIGFIFKSSLVEFQINITYLSQILNESFFRFYLVTNSHFVEMKMNHSSYLTLFLLNWMTNKRFCMYCASKYQFFVHCDVCLTFPQSLIRKEALWIIMNNAI